MSATIPSIAIIVASTRPARFADVPLAWVLERAALRSDLAFDVIDLRDHQLGYFDRAASPSMAPRAYGSEEERELGERLDAADGILVIANEYNHGFTAPLKNTLDHFYVEFNHKVAGFLGYGNVGGSRAIEQLRLVVAELEMVSARHTVHLLGQHILPVRTGTPADEAFAPLEPRLELLFDDLAWWGRVLHDARTADALNAEDAG